MAKKTAVHGWDMAARMSENPRMDNAVWEYRKLASDEARAAFVDKWARLAARDMDSTWSMFYDALRIIKERKLYENSAVMEDGKARASFEEYWADVAEKPFQTWAELESTYHHIRENCPELLEKLNYDGARKLVTGKTRKGGQDGNQNASKGEKRIGNLPNRFQADRAKENGVSLRTQKKLDKLAKHRPDLLERVQTGELTPDGACGEAGWKGPSFNCPKDVQEAAKRIHGHFKGERLAALIRALSELV